MWRLLELNTREIPRNHSFTSAFAKRADRVFFYEEHQALQKAAQAKIIWDEHTRTRALSAVDGHFRDQIGLDVPFEGKDFLVATGGRFHLM
ncbi:hypothetical protein TNIN_160061 [Trichonephila inaurata madagascariensis]|uniref:Uncharacterized protein n=1 Tax=Trichonephila inaurata madagascariensis TaxID=2747483 RepID=A0A8X7BU89_9ARAC|nr:hypothetical protein TNIN_160061 [Trichonephila inaurata madagascariensis]